MPDIPFANGLSVQKALGGADSPIGGAGNVGDVLTRTTGSGVNGLPQTRWKPPTGGGNTPVQSTPDITGGTQTLSDLDSAADEITLIGSPSGACAISLSGAVSRPNGTPLIIRNDNSNAYAIGIWRNGSLIHTLLSQECALYMWDDTGDGMGGVGVRFVGPTGVILQDGNAGHFAKGDGSKAYIAQADLPLATAGNRGVYALPASASGQFLGDDNAFHTVGNDWADAYNNTDLTALTTNAITGDGAFTFDGNAWLAENTSDSGHGLILGGSSGIIQGTGLVLALQANDTGNYTGNTRSNPLLSIPVTTIFPGYDLSRHKLRFWVRGNISVATTNFQCLSMGMERNPVGVGDLFNAVIKKGFHSSHGNSTIYQGVNAYGTSQMERGSTVNYSDDVFVIEMNGPYSWGFYSGLWSSGWPSSAALRLRRRYVFNGAQPDSDIDPAIETSALVGLFVGVASVAGVPATTATFTAMRLQYL